MENSAYIYSFKLRTLVQLNSLCFYKRSVEMISSYERFQENIKQLKFEGNWVEILQKISFLRYSWGKYLEQNEEIH